MKFCLVIVFMLVNTKEAVRSQLKRTCPISSRQKSSIASIAVVASSYALPAKGSTKAALKKKPCIKDCGDVYKPVCGGDGSGKNNKSFGSECVLSNYNCETGNNLKIQSQGECPGGGGVRLS